MNERKTRTRLQPSNLYEEARRRQTELLRVQKECEESLRKAPEGRIHIKKSKGNAQYYWRKDKKDKSGQYLPKANKTLIRPLLQKAYDEKVLKLVKQELKGIEYLLKYAGNAQQQIRQAYSDHHEETRKEIAWADCSEEDYIAKWKGMTYTPKKIEDNVPYYETANKERVRSKSELNIANTLARYGIPYKYECPLRLGDGRTIYPDFTILDVKNRREIYWEHRGMMDDREYLKHAVDRVKTYTKEGYILGKNLLLSEETGASPLGTNEIESIIGAYFEKRKKGR